MPKTLWLLCLGLSNHVIFFESLQAMDYPIALFFLSAGWALMSRNFNILAVLAFAASCGARPNFMLFSLLLIIFSDQSVRSRLEQAFSVVIVGALFFVPVWMHSHFGFDWIAAERSDTRLTATLARVFYKSYLVLGLPVWILLLATQHKWRPALANCPNIVRRQAVALLLGNLAVFYFLPAEQAYLQAAIVAVFLLLVMTTQVIFRALFLLANLATWAFQIQFLHIGYKSQDPCKAVAAVSADVVFQVGPGAVASFYERQSREHCFIKNILD